MILALSGSAAGRLATEFREGTVRKEYVARVWGKFPE
jgi:23S rRNA-/tRNA-specific pseudouridylate synthase